VPLVWLANRLIRADLATNDMTARVIKLADGIRDAGQMNISLLVQLAALTLAAGKWSEWFDKLQTFATGQLDKDSWGRVDGSPSLSLVPLMWTGNDQNPDVPGEQFLESLKGLLALCACMPHQAGAVTLENLLDFAAGIFADPDQDNAH
jgi:hypothetical protein